MNLTTLHPSRKGKMSLISVVYSVYILLCEFLSRTGCTVTEINLLSPPWPESLHSSHNMYLLCYQSLKVGSICYNMMSNTSQLLTWHLFEEIVTGSISRGKPACDVFLGGVPTSTLVSNMEQVTLAATNLSIRTAGRKILILHEQLDRFSRVILTVGFTLWTE